MGSHCVTANIVRAAPKGVWCWVAFIDVGHVFRSCITDMELKPLCNILGVLFLIILNHTPKRIIGDSN